jgi:hypothetical protein
VSTRADDDSTRRKRRITAPGTGAPVVGEASRGILEATIARLLDARAFIDDVAADRAR